MLFAQAQLAAVDVVIVVAYALATTLLGVWFNRHQHDLNTYFVGDRDVSWWLVLVSIVVIVILLTMGGQIKNVFSNVVTALNA